LPILLLTYDLNKEKSKEDYEGFYKVIRQRPWARLSESTYAIDTYTSPGHIFNQLQPFVDENDSVLIVTLSAPWTGRAPEAVVRWLRGRIPN
jgi:hypothetical protein